MFFFALRNKHVKIIVWKRKNIPRKIHGRSLLQHYALLINQNVQRDNGNVSLPFCSIRTGFFFFSYIHTSAAVRSESRAFGERKKKFHSGSIQWKNRMVTCRRIRLFKNCFVRSILRTDQKISDPIAGVARTLRPRNGNITAKVSDHRTCVGRVRSTRIDMREPVLQGMPAALSGPTLTETRWQRLINYNVQTIK